MGAWKNAKRLNNSHMGFARGGIWAKSKVGRASANGRVLAIINIGWYKEAQRKHAVEHTYGDGYDGLTRGLSRVQHWTS